MLERDVIDKKPNVTFDEIAELNSAKSALKEAILLPLLMPDVFVVSNSAGILYRGFADRGKEFSCLDHQELAKRCLQRLLQQQGRPHSSTYRLHLWRLNGAESQKGWSE